MSRGWLRRKYSIPGNDCHDFMISWCCSACALCQEHRELLIRGHTRGGGVPGAAAAMAPPQQTMVANPEQGYPVYPAMPPPDAPPAGPYKG